MKEVGGPSYLVKIMSSSGVEVIGARDFADQIRELAQRRKLIDGLRGIIQGAQGHTDVAELVAEAEDVLSDAADADHQAVQVTAAKAVSRVLEGFQTRATGVSSGIPPIDSGLGQLLPKQLVIVAGRPSMGKSAVASSYGLGAASRGHGVLFISLEMSADELAERIAADFCFDSDVQVPYAAITAGHVTAEQGRQIARSIDKLESLPFEIADLSSASLSRLNSLVRRTARKFKARGKRLELVIVDYLQLVRPDHKGKDRYEDVSEVSRGLKSLAKANGVTVLALTQLSRKVEERADKRPLMADLRDSGQIEQDADSIMFLFREEYYLSQCEPPIGDPKHPAWEQRMAEAQGRIEFIVAKLKRGRTGTSVGKFFGAYQATRG
jgi:replicative DNA helicase